jgi:hypothetical protein
MKYNHIHTTRSIAALIAVLLLLIFSNTIAQPGYPPWARRAPYRPVIVPLPPQQNYRQAYPPKQNYPQDYNQNIQSDGYRPIIGFSIHFDPLISWFTTDRYETRSDGVVPGFKFGISYNKYFSPNYSFSSGIDIINGGGRIINSGTTRFELKDYSSTILTIPPEEAITYNITYLSIPLGLKLQTNQIGYGRFFSDVGLDPKIVIGGRADIPSVDIKGGNALSELNLFNLSFHIMVGMEYPLAGNNSFIVGIGFDKNLFDITRDNGDQPSNVVIQKMLSFRLGMSF